MPSSAGRAVKSTVNRLYAKASECFFESLGHFQMSSSVVDVVDDVHE